jgi:uncharacterized protein involved in exopolysaccharide biosynthesis
MNNNLSKNNKSDEIDLIEIALNVWRERRIVYKTIIVFVFLGLLMAFGSKKEYKSDVTFILNDNQGGSAASSLISQFGGLAGINIGGSEKSGIVSPELYPNIIRSTSFIIELMESEIQIGKLDTVSIVFDYFTKLDKPSVLSYITGYTIGLPFKILNSFKKKKDVDETMEELNENSDILRISQRQENVIKNLKDRISINLDEKTGVIKLSVEFPDAIGAADLTNLAYRKLTDYLINYKIEKSKEDYTFIKERYNESKLRYENTQKELANFRDANRNVTSAYFQTEEERLNNEYQIAYKVYNGLAQQLEQAKIKIQEAMPVFKVVDKVQVPLGRSKPRRAVTLILSLTLGIFLGLIIILFKSISRSFVLPKKSKTYE